MIAQAAAAQNVQQLPITGRSSPFVNWLGLRRIDLKEGRSVLGLTPTDHHQNAHDIVHGGVLMTMLDVGMSSAARSALHSADLAEADVGMITIEMKATFMKPCSGELRVKGLCLSHTRSMAFCEAEIVDSHERVCAKASGTFKVVRPKKEAA